MLDIPYSQKTIEETKLSLQEEITLSRERCTSLENKCQEQKQEFECRNALANKKAAESAAMVATEKQAVIELREANEHPRAQMGQELEDARHASREFQLQIGVLRQKVAGLEAKLHAATPVNCKESILEAELGAVKQERDDLVRRTRTIHSRYELGELVGMCKIISLKLTSVLGRAREMPH